MDKSKIVEIQGHFENRGKFNKAIDAIKCYTKGSSVFYSYVDGWGNKKTVNIPIEPTDLLPLLELYVEKIDNDIIGICNEKPVKVEIRNKEQLQKVINDLQHRYPNSYTTEQEVMQHILDAYYYFEQRGGTDIYQVLLCRDWEDKAYEFQHECVCQDTLYVAYNGTIKG